MRHHFVILLCGSLVLAGCPQDVDDPVNAPIDPNAIAIGLLQALSSGQILQRQQAAQLAVQEINAAGGVNGRPLALRLAYDNNNDPVAGVPSAQALVDHGVVAIIGANASRVTIPVAQQVTIPANLALISPGSTSPLISTLVDNDTVYRIPPSDALQGRFLAEQVWNEGRTSVAIFSQDEPYGRGLAEAFKARYLALGGSVQAEVYPAVSRTSGYSAEIGALYAGGAPPALMLFAFAVQTSNFLRELYAARGSLPQLYGVDANLSQDTLNNAPIQVLGMRGSNPSPPVNSPYHQRFADAFLAQVGFVPEANTENTYDAVYLIALALARAGSNDRAAVLANLREVSRPDGVGAVAVGPGDFRLALTAIQAGQDIDYQGANSAIDFDANGDPSAANYQYLEVRQRPDGSLYLVELANVSYP